MWIETVNTWLPSIIFPGFYNTRWGYDEEKVIEELDIDNRDDAIEWLTYNVDYERYEKDVAHLIVEQGLPAIIYKAFSDALILSGHYTDLFPEIELVKIDSPRQYNYRNDSLDIMIKVNMEIFLQQLFYPNFEKLQNFIKNEFTSRSGYTSPLVNSDMLEWIEPTKNFTDLNGVYFSVLLAGLLSLKGFDRYKIENILMEIFDTKIELQNYFSYSKMRKDLHLG